MRRVGFAVTVCRRSLARLPRMTVRVPPAVAARMRPHSYETGRPVRDLVDEAIARYWGLPLD
jgi:hypothetical protein